MPFAFDLSWSDIWMLFAAFMTLYGLFVTLVLSDVAREYYKLTNAIREHHGQRADDRCWMDDDRLYAAAGLPAVDRRVGDKTAMLHNCQRFIQARTNGGGWATYAELEAQILKQQHKIADLESRLRREGGAA